MKACGSREEFSKETLIRVSYLFRFIHKARPMPEWPGGAFGVEVLRRRRMRGGTGVGAAQ